MRRTSKIKAAAAAVVALCATVASGQTPRTESNPACGPNNPDGPCYTTQPKECYSASGRCVGTEPLCRFEWTTGATCATGTCQSDGTCRPNPGPGPGPGPTGECTAGCGANQICAAGRCVNKNTGTGTGCAGSPARR